MTRFGSMAALLVGCYFFFMHGHNSPGTIAETPLPQVRGVVTASYFGMDIGYPDKVAWPPIPFGTLRLWDSSVTWLDIEPKKGQWEFGRLDKLVSQAQAHHVDVVLPLAMSPEWASARPKEFCPYMHGGCAAEPAEMQDWIDYVDKIARRYRGKVHYYEIWNELNAASFWSGKPEAMIALMRVAYREIKRIDPTAKVISPSIVGSSYDVLNRMLDLGMGQHADIIGWHLYMSPSPPEVLGPVVGILRAILQAHHIDKPIWNTESNWLPPLKLSERMDAAYVIRSMVVTRGSGLDRFIWYQWDNHEGVTVAMLKAGNVQITQAATAYATLYRWLVGNVLDGCNADASSVWSCGVEFAGGQRGQIVWHPNGPVRISKFPGWKPKTVEDYLGNVSPWKGDLTVDDSPVMLTGGR